MPGKKGKKGGKGKKGKKGKKGSKKDSKLLVAKSTAKVWESRLGLIESSRTEFRTAARRLLNDNDELHRQVHQTEKDTIDVVTFLKTKDVQKDDQITQLQGSVKTIREDHRTEKEIIIEDYQQQVADLNTKLSTRAREMGVLKAELKAVQEFRKRKTHMQRELDEIKDAMNADGEDHKSRLSNMEEKFFKEKKRLQQEATHKIAELAEKAHTEAIENLDETTRSVYKENVRLTEALGYHTREEQKLQQEVERLQKENAELSLEEQSQDTAVRAKIADAKKRREEIAELQEKVTLLETGLAGSVSQFREEKQRIILKKQMEDESAVIEMDKLRRMMELKAREMLKIKKLAKHVLDERTEVEQFFLESLDMVKKELVQNKAQYRRDALQSYQQRVDAGHRGEGELARMRSLHKSDTSATMLKDAESTDRLLESRNEIDVASMPWEQKERVLRFLFVKMNKHLRQQAGLETSKTQLSFASQPEECEPADQTFLTQAVLDDTGELGSTEQPSAVDT